MITSPDARAPGCPATGRPREGGTLHAAEVLGRERWRADESPHLVPYGLVIRAGASLELDPCALVRVGAARGVTVAARGELVARGEAQRPIVFERLDAAPWTSLAVEWGVSRRTVLADVDLVGAGAAGSERYAASLVVGAESLVAQRVRAQRSAAWGVWLREGGSFAEGSSVDTRGGSEGDAVVDDADAVGSLPLLNALPRSEAGLVLVSGARPVVRRDARWGGRGARYAVRGGVRLRVEGPSAPQLTLAPGTTLIFGEDSALEVGVDAPGAIWVDASRDDAVTVRGEGERAASWLGVTLGAQIDLSRSAFRGVRVVGAGAPSGAAVSGCGCAEGVRGDAAMIALHAVGAERIVANVLLERGFARGVGVLRSASTGRSEVGLVRGGRVDVTRARVACAELAPLVEGRCPEGSP